MPPATSRGKAVWGCIKGEGTGARRAGRHWHRMEKEKVGTVMPWEGETTRGTSDGADVAVEGGSAGWGGVLGGGGGGIRV
jgi:hypothetical protein